MNQPAPIKSRQSSGQKLALIVDDNDLIRSTLKMLLSDMGYESIEAPNGYEGVINYWCFESRIDFVLLDFEMPVMDGLRALKDLILINPDVKVIMATGSLDGTLKQKIKAIKDIPIIKKPFNFTELKKTIKEFSQTINPRI